MEKTEAYESRLAKAIKAVEEESLTAYKAAKLYGNKIFLIH